MGDIPRPRPSYVPPKGVHPPAGWVTGWKRACVSTPCKERRLGRPCMTGDFRRPGSSRNLRGYRAPVGTLGAVEQPWDPAVDAGSDLHGRGPWDGDPPSVADRVESLIPVVSRVVRARVQDPTTAEDLIQETL